MLLRQTFKSRAVIAIECANYEQTVHINALCLKIKAYKQKHVKIIKIIKEIWTKRARQHSPHAQTQNKG